MSRVESAASAVKVLLYLSWPLMFFGLWIGVEVGSPEIAAAVCGSGFVMFLIGLLAVPALGIRSTLTHDTSK